MSIEFRCIMTKVYCCVFTPYPGLWFFDSIPPYMYLCDSKFWSLVTIKTDWTSKMMGIPLRSNTVPGFQSNTTETTMDVTVHFLINRKCSRMYPKRDFSRHYVNRVVVLSLKKKKVAKIKKKVKGPHFTLEEVGNRKRL